MLKKKFKRHKYTTILLSRAIKICFLGGTEILKYKKFWIACNILKGGIATSNLNQKKIGPFWTYKRSKSNDFHEKWNNVFSFSIRNHMHLSSLSLFTYTSPNFDQLSCPLPFSSPITHFTIHLHHFSLFRYLIFLPFSLISFRPLLPSPESVSSLRVTSTMYQFFLITLGNAWLLQPSKGCSVCWPS